MLKEITEQLRAGLSLSSKQIERSVTFLTGDYPDEAKAEFLRALASKGETAEEIAGFAKAFLERATTVDVDPAMFDGPLIDVCGTGGDKLGIFNVSTTVALIAAAGGAVVAKHGNRGVSSKSGGADVLEALGVMIEAEPEKVVERLKTHRFAFLFAPKFHPAFKAVANVRRQLGAEGVVTIFNVLGPLLNPMCPSRQLTGLFRKDLVRTYAEVLRHLGRQMAWIVHGSGGAGGMDEISTLGPTHVAELVDGAIQEYVLNLEESGIPRGNLKELAGGDAHANAAIVKGILSGHIRDGRRELAVANAGAAFVVAGLCANLEEGMQRARETIDSGAAGALLGKLLS